jgi:hypothetical protein
MPTLKVTVQLTPDYNQAKQNLVVLNRTTIDLVIDIQEGSHTYTSPYKTVGTLKNFKIPRLEAGIRFSYTYNGADDTLELYGSDYYSESQSTCLLTRPEGSSQICYQRAYRGDPSPCGSNPNWTYTTEYTPGLWAALFNMARLANDAIIEAAKRTFAVVRVNTPAPTLASAEELNKWMVVTTKDGEILGDFDPTVNYPEDTIMVNYLQSTWGGEVTFTKNENIANVIGSTPDPKISGKPWIEIWERQYGLEDSCTSHNWASGKTFACNDDTRSNIVGGHVITGTTAKTMPAGSNNVYIVPICKAHNNNDNVYMRADVYVKGIWLKNYLR